GFQRVLQLSEGGWRLEWPAAAGDAEPHLWGLVPQIGECGIDYFLPAPCRRCGRLRARRRTPFRRFLRLRSLSTAFWCALARFFSDCLVRGIVSPQEKGIMEPHRRVPEAGKSGLANRAGHAGPRRGVEEGAAGLGVADGAVAGDL